MRKLVMFLTLVVIALVGYAQRKPPLADKRLAGLETALENVLNTWKVPGFAIAIVEKNKIIYAKGFGFRDLEAKLPMTPNTQLAIGSCTKAFTAALLGLLREEGKMSFDESPRKHVPELRFFNNDMDHLITIKDLMSHIRLFQFVILAHS